MLFDLVFLIKNAIKNAVTTVVSLYMANLENPENQDSENAANTSEAGTLNEIAHFNLYLINSSTIKFIRVF